ncbi:MAG: matrixin family metalloprotease [Nocardioidaceae bacterium]
MRRLLAELDRIDAGSRARYMRPGGRSLPRRLGLGAIVAVVVVALGAFVAHKELGISVDAQGLHRAAPLGRPPAVAHGVGSFKFMARQPPTGDPVAYDPCRPIEYVVNDSVAPPGTDGLLEDAVGRVSAATGLVFEREGTTDRLPGSNEPLMTRPVLVAWTTPRTVPDLAGRVAGVGGSTAVAAGNGLEQKYVTGQVALDAPQLAQVLARPGGALQVRAIMMHELGHLVGLAHVDDSRELMYRDNVGRLDFGPGDREGLATLGSGRCFH